MKKLIFTIAFLLITVNARAVINIDYTGNVAQKMDINGYSPISGSGNWVGGRIANNTLGYAQQFNLIGESYFSSINFDIEIISMGNYEIPAGYSIPANGIGGVDFKFKIYEGDAGYSNYFGNNAIRPDVSQLLYTSDPVVFKFNEVELISSSGTTYLKDTQYYYNQSNDINMVFSPGTYWIAQEWEDSMDMGLLTSKEIEGHHAPEPATMLLFGTGLVGFIWKRRKFVAAGRSFIKS